jgi:hypothetical protein
MIPKQCFRIICWMTHHNYYFLARMRSLWLLETRQSMMNVEQFWYDESLIRKGRARTVVRWLVGDYSEQDILDTIRHRHEVEAQAIQILIDNDLRHQFDAEMDRQIREKVGHTKRYPCAECGGGLCELHDQ